MSSTTKTVTRNAAKTTGATKAAKAPAATTKTAKTTAPPMTMSSEQVQEFLRLDGMVNLMLGIGTPDDKRLATRFTYDPTTAADGDVLVAGDDMAHNVVWIPAEEMTREWIDIPGEDGSAIEKVLDKIGAREALTEALAWERAFGGSVVVIGIDQQTRVKNQQGIDTDEVDYSLPLKPGGNLLWLHTFDRHEVTVVNDRWGDPEFYEVQMATTGIRTRIHHTRCLRFSGTPLPKRLRAQDGWGQSVFDRIKTRIRDVNIGTDGIAAALADFDVAVLLLDSFTALLASDAKGVNRQRLAKLAQFKSTHRMMTLDAKDKLENVARNFAGVPDVIDRLLERVAAAARMPVSLLMGRSPAGLNATGDTDVRNWYAHVAAQQTLKLRRPLQYLIDLIAASMKIPDDDVPSLTFRPLWAPTEAEQATTHLTQAQADAIYVGLGDVSAEEISRSRFAKTGYSVETQLDWETRDATDAADTDNVDLEDEGDGIVPADGGVAAGGSADVQKTALNGAQLTGAMSIISAVAKREIPRDAGVNLLALGFQLTETQASKLLGSAGSTFEPADPAPTTPTTTNADAG